MSPLAQSAAPVGAELFRTSHHSGRLEIELAGRNIPFVKYGGLKFIEAAHVKDLLAILRWAENPRDAPRRFSRFAIAAGDRAGQRKEGDDASRRAPVRPGRACWFRTP